MVGARNVLRAVHLPLVQYLPTPAAPARAGSLFGTNSPSPAAYLTPLLGSSWSIRALKG